MDNLIHLEQAPLEEVVCGVHFAGVKWSDIHFGLFFHELAGRYWHTQRRPRLSLFDPGIQETPHIRLLAEPELPLLRYESPDSPFLLQLQNDAFFVNWRRQAGAFDYPHFRSREGGKQGVWDHFLSEWEGFRRFCEKQINSTPEVLACHLAYIDHLVQGETWQDPLDLVQWFCPLEGLRHYTSVSVFNLTVRYEVDKMPMHFNVRPAVRASDKKQLFIFEFVVTERLSGGISLEAWFNHAHEVILQDFLSKTTKDAHKAWGLT